MQETLTTSQVQLFVSCALPTSLSRPKITFIKCHEIHYAKSHYSKRKIKLKMAQQLQLEVGSESKDSFKKTEFFPVLRDAI